MWQLSLALLLPAVACYLTIAQWRAAFDAPRASAVLGVSIAIGLALGVGACGYFLWRSFVGPVESGWVASEMVFWVLALAIGWWANRTRGAAAGSRRAPDAEHTAVRRVLFAGFVIAVVANIIVFVLVTKNAPHAPGDAAGIWNLHARFLYRGADHWRDGFTSLLSWSHPDYPLLVPGGIARFWSYLGRESAAAPAAIAFLFSLATVGVLVSSLHVLRSVGAGFLAAIVLLVTGRFVQQGLSQYADVPLAFFILAVLAIFAIHDDRKATAPAPLVLAGLLAGMAAWTKNEGILFVVAVLVARVAVVAQARGVRVLAGELVAFGAGLVPVLALLVYFKLVVAPANDLISLEQMSALFDRLFDVSRHGRVAAASARGIVLFGGVAWLVLAGFLLLLSRRRGPGAGKVWQFPAAVLLLMLVGYYLIYVVTPHDIDWHLMTSLNRILMHLWPALLLLMFSVCGTPDGSDASRE